MLKCIRGSTLIVKKPLLYAVSGVSRLIGRWYPDVFPLYVLSADDTYSLIIPHNGMSVFILRRRKYTAALRICQVFVL